MPKVISSIVSPGKTKKCPVCLTKYKIRGFSNHVKKCERLREEREGDRKYLKQLKTSHAPARSEVDTGMEMMVYPDL